MVFDELARLEAVRRYAVADSAVEAAFDRVVALAAHLLSAPVALFSIIDADRIWFKARHGLDLEYMDREPGFCASALSQGSSWLVANAAEVADARGNRLAKEFGLNAYAGVPLAVQDGARLGTLCVMDRKAREFASRDVGILDSLASLIVDRLELRLVSQDAAHVAAEAAREREAAFQRANKMVNDGRLLAALVQSSQDAIVSKDLNGVVTSWNPAAEDIFGYPAAEMIGQSITRIIPPDRLEEETFVLDKIRRGERIEHYETLRRRRDGGLIPISLTISPIKGEDDTILGASKIARNISDRVESQNRIHALLREVNHRVKNQYAVILSMIRQSANQAGTAQEFEARIRDRIMALARSHDLLVSHDWNGAPIQDVLTAQSEGFDQGTRITASGPPVLLTPMAVQYLGMAFHELGTKALHHNGFAGGGSQVAVSWRLVTRSGIQWVELSWTERHLEELAQGMPDRFALSLLEKITPAALGGAGKIERTIDGVSWRLEAPLHLLELEPLKIE